jgi:hypothetical protein
MVGRKMLTRLSEIPQSGALTRMTDMMVPIGIAMQLAGGYDLKGYPKMTGASSATKSSPEIAAYLAKSATMSAMPKMKPVLKPVAIHHQINYVQTNT